MTDKKGTATTTLSERDAGALFAKGKGVNGVIFEYEKDSTTGEYICFICAIFAVDVVFEPCGHFVTCRCCAYEWLERHYKTVCPLCNMDVQNETRLDLSKVMALEDLSAEEVERYNQNGDLPGTVSVPGDQERMKIGAPIPVSEGRIAPDCFKLLRMPIDALMRIDIEKVVLFLQSDLYFMGNGDADVKRGHLVAVQNVLATGQIMNTSYHTYKAVVENCTSELRKMATSVNGYKSMNARQRRDALNIVLRDFTNQTIPHLCNTPRKIARAYLEIAKRAMCPELYQMEFMPRFYAEAEFCDLEVREAYPEIYEDLCNDNLRELGLTPIHPRHQDDDLMEALYHDSIRDGILSGKIDGWEGTADIVRRLVDDVPSFRNELGTVGTGYAIPALHRVSALAAKFRAHCMEKLFKNEWTGSRYTRVARSVLSSELSEAGVSDTENSLYLHNRESTLLQIYKSLVVERLLKNQPANVSSERVKQILEHDLACVGAGNRAISSSDIRGMLSEYRTALENTPPESRRRYIDYLFIILAFQNAGIQLPSTRRSSRRRPQQA